MAPNVIILHVWPEFANLYVSGGEQICKIKFKHTGVLFPSKKEGNLIFL